MNKTKVFCLIFLGVILPLKAQLYTPSAVIQGNSGNDNVGIGTATPAGKLHINNAGTSGQLDYNLIVQKTVVADNNKSAVGLLLSTECCGAFGKSAIVHERTGGYGLGNLHFLNSNAFDTSIPTLLDAKMTINSNGNVGIGTTNPNSKLTIRSATSGVSIHPGGNPYFGTLAFNRESGTGEIFDANGQAFQINNGGNDKNLHFQVYNGDGSLVTNEALVINGINGNVGIGTTNPTSLLTVAGNIASREVKVTVDAGADFVFEKEYHLPSLSSLDTYIKENKHLPEIASAKEMQANGINLSEMNIKLLQKMEEMTLYIIQQDKEIKRQAKEITTFKNVFERLSKIEEKLESK